MEIKTIEIPKIKFVVRVWPKRAADAIPVKIVATVDEYFFKIVSAWIREFFDLTNTQHKWDCDLIKASA